MNLRYSILLKTALIILFIFSCLYIPPNRYDAFHCSFLSVLFDGDSKYYCLHIDGNILSSGEINSDFKRLAIDLKLAPITVSVKVIYIIVIALISIWWILTYYRVLWKPIPLMISTSVVFFLSQVLLLYIIILIIIYKIKMQAAIEASMVLPGSMMYLAIILLLFLLAPSLWHIHIFIQKRSQQKREAHLKSSISFIRGHREK